MAIARLHGVEAVQQRLTLHACDLLLGPGSGLSKLDLPDTKQQGLRDATNCR